jgi:hypothetical protein
MQLRQTRLVAHMSQRQSGGGCGKRNEKKPQVKSDDEIRISLNMRTLALTTKAKMAIFNLAHEIMSRDVCTRKKVRGKGRAAKADGKFRYRHRVASASDFGESGNWAITSREL